MTDVTLTANAPAAAPASAPVAAPAAASPAPAVASTPATPAVAALVAAPAPIAAAPVAAPAVPAAPAAAPVAAPVAPEKYDFKAPEGASAFNETVLSTYGEAAKALNLTQDQAQDMLAKVAPVIQAQQVAALTEFYADIGGLPDTWVAQVKADKELGGADMDAKLAVAAKARDLGGEPFAKLLNKTGLGNHPEVIRTFYRIGKSLSEDKFIPGGGGSGTQLTPAQRLYGSK